MAGRLANKVALITGASKGIGRAIAKLFAQEGAKVVLNYVSDDNAAQSSASEIRAFGGSVTLFKGDVSKKADMLALAAVALEQYDRIDILCANAGIYPLSRLEEISEAEWDRVQDVNLKGTFLAVQACLPQMMAQRYGRIVVISSTTGLFTSLPLEVHYGASKAGQVGFVRSAALPLARHKITINAILPGYIRTEGMEESASQEWLSRLTKHVPLQRLGEPFEVAQGALFLAGDEAAYITGQTITIDGGLVVPELPLDMFDF